MVGELARIAERSDLENHYQGQGRAARLRAELERLGDQAPGELYLDAGTATVQAGLEQEGIEILQRLYGGLRDGRVRGDTTARTMSAFHLGVAWLRHAETQNCCIEHNQDSCILPIRGGGVHRRKEASRQAARLFLEVCDNTPEGAYWHLAARWLLNITHMTLGTWPEAVAERHRIPATAFQSDVEFPRLMDVAAAVGLDTESLSGSVVAEDFDDDGLVDLLVSSWDTSGQLRAFRNRGDGSFEDRTEAAGLVGLFGGLNMVQADYDNDGDVDVLVLRGAWLFERGEHPNSLLRNDGGLRFTDVTYDAGLAEVSYPTQTAAWADYDLDGDLDVYIGNESSDRRRYPGQLFENRGDGTFVDVAGRVGVENMAFCKAVAWGDYDNDGDPDLYLSNNGQPNRLYRNDPGGFVDVAAEVGVDMPLSSFPAWFWDYDNDGNLDLFVSSYATGIGHVAAHYQGLETAPHEQMRLYRGIGGGRMVDVAERCGLRYPGMPMGSNYGDLDGDGWLDFYLGTGDTDFFSLMPNVLFLGRATNDGERGFQDATFAAGLGHLQKGHGIAFADFDNDGDLDLFEQMGGAYRGDGYRDALYLNPGFGNRWVDVRLQGMRTNRCAIGARIRVESTDADGRVRVVHRTVGSGGSFGASPLRQVVGLGAAVGDVAIEVDWPVGRTTQRWEGIALGSTVRLVEGEGDHRQLPRRTFPLGR